MSTKIKTELAICHDCGAKEGELHQGGCDMEICPFCGNQLITCNCCYKKLGIDVREGTWAYFHGLTGEQSEKWDAMLRKKGLIPYVQIPLICAMCGALWPEMFMTDDWETYVIPPLQDKILCISCYNKMKLLFPKGWRNVK
jgi:hypothetical protein